jgi:hypothetical protein
MEGWCDDSSEKELRRGCGLDLRAHWCKVGASNSSRFVLEVAPSGQYEQRCPGLASDLIEIKFKMYHYLDTL